MVMITHLAAWSVFLAGFFSNFWHVIGLALRVSPSLPRAILDYPHSAWLALSVAFLAGVSLMVNDSALLFANRVRPRRFVAGLVLNGILHPLSQAVLAAAIWLAATVVFRARQPLELAILIVWLGSAPLMFGFLGMASTLGDYPRWAVQGWSWLIILVAIRSGFHLAWWRALGAVILGWLLVKSVKALLDEPLGVVSDRVWRLVTGSSLGMSLRTQRELRSGQIERETVMRLSRAVGDRLAGLESSHES